MPLIKIRTYEPKIKEYQISPETAKAIIAAIDCHMIATKPIALTKESQQSFSFFKSSTTMISAFHLVSHVRPGDELEINDLVTQEKYKVKFSAEFVELCRYYRLYRYMDPLYEALAALGAKEKYSVKRSTVFRDICYKYCPIPQDMGEHYFKDYLTTLEKIIKNGDNEEKAAPPAEKAVLATKNSVADAAGPSKKP